MADHADRRAPSRRPEDEMARIVQVLDGWASSARRSPDGIAVVLPDGRPVDVILSPDRLDDFAIVGFIDMDGVAEDIIDKLGRCRRTAAT